MTDVVVTAVDLTLKFQCELPEDDLEADEAADEIGDAIVAAVRRAIEQGALMEIAPESVEVGDWTSEPVTT